MELRYVAGRSGSKCDDNIATTRTDEGSSVNLILDEPANPLPYDEPTTHPSPSQESTSPSTSTGPHNKFEVKSTAYTGIVEAPASASPRLPSPKKAGVENDAEAKGQDPSDSNDEPTGSSSTTPAITNTARGHKPRTSTLSGSTAVSRRLVPGKVDANYQVHEEDHDTVSLSSKGGPMGSELNPATHAFDLEEHEGQQQQSSRGDRKHNCPTAEAIDENRRIYIGNLKFTLNHDSIAALLEKLDSYKPDCCCIYVPPPSKSKNPKTKPEHQNRGYCFVTYQDSDSAAAAMGKLNHFDFAGRRLVSRRCLPKGLTYNEYLEREGFIQQGGALGRSPPGQSTEVQQDGFSPDGDSSTDKYASPSPGPSGEESPSQPPRARQSLGHQRPQTRRCKGKHIAPEKGPTCQYFDLHPHHNGPYIAPEPQVMHHHPDMVFYEPNMGMTGYNNPFVYHYQPPAVESREAFLKSLMRGTVPEGASVANGSESGSGDGIFDNNNEDDIYIPPSDSMQAAGRTIEVLNLPAVFGTWRNFKTFIHTAVSGIAVTGVSEPIYQYSPKRPSYPVIMGSGSPLISSTPGSYCTLTFHERPWFYCYIQLKSKEEAEKAFIRLHGMQMEHGGNIRQCRVNKSWKLHGSD